MNVTEPPTVCAGAGFPTVPYQFSTDPQGVCRECGRVVPLVRKGRPKHSGRITIKPALVAAVHEATA